jgi:hypothetical protein
MGEITGLKVKFQVKDPKKNLCSQGFTLSNSGGLSHEKVLQTS